MEPKDKIILALDYETLEQAVRTVYQVDKYVGVYKIPPHLIYRHGLETICQQIDYCLAERQFGKNIFVDVKLNDTPRTVGLAVAELARQGVGMITVHASAGVDALQVASENAGSSKLLAVLLLTSLSDHHITVNFELNRMKYLERLALVAATSGVDGVVCAAKDIPFLKGIMSERCRYITPGISLCGDVLEHQASGTTAHEALKLGATRVVVGRAITEAEVGPRGAAKKILMELALKGG